MSSVSYSEFCCESTSSALRLGMAPPTPSSTHSTARDATLTEPILTHTPVDLVRQRETSLRFKGGSRDHQMLVTSLGYSASAPQSLSCTQRSGLVWQLLTQQRSCFCRPSAPRVWSGGGHSGLECSGAVVLRRVCEGECSGGKGSFSSMGEKVVIFFSFCTCNVRDFPQNPIIFFLFLSTSPSLST